MSKRKTDAKTTEGTQTAATAQTGTQPAGAAPAPTEAAGGDGVETKDVSPVPGDSSAGDDVGGSGQAGEDGVDAGVAGADPAGEPGEGPTDDGGLQHPTDVTEAEALEGGDSAAASAEGLAAAEPPARSPLASLDANLLAAMFAASGAYGTRRDAVPAVDLSWLASSERECESSLGIAAAFLRSNRDATPETLTIQLRLKGVRGAPAPTGLVEIAWRVFAYTLNALDAHDRAEAEAEAAAEKAEEASRPRGAMPGQLAAKPASRSRLQPTQVARVHGHKKPGGA